MVVVNLLFCSHWEPHDTRWIFILLDVLVCSMAVFFTMLPYFDNRFKFKTNEWKYAVILYTKTSNKLFVIQLSYLYENVVPSFLQ